MNGIENWIMVIMMLPIVLITTITPLITRKVEAFGVTVQDGAKEQPFLKGIIRRYMVVSMGLGLILTVSMLLLLLSISGEEQLITVMLTHVFGYLVITFILYYVNHRKVKLWKQSQSWSNEHMKSHKVVVQTGFRRHKMIVSLLWFIPHTLLVGVTMLISVLNYDKYPQMIPMQYNFAGEVTRSVEKSMASVMGLSWIAVAIIIIFIFVNISIAKAKQLVESSDPDGSLERNIRFRYMWSMFMTIMGFLVVLLMCFGQLFILYELSSSVMGIVTSVFIAIILIGSIGLSLVTGQGGSRLKSKDSQQKNSISVADNDEYWKAGIFYWNPKDPSIFIEKRFGIGWTMNFAKPMSWIFIVGIIAIAVIPSVFLL